MPLIDIAPLFQTVISLMIAAFPVIDTDDKKVLIWEVLKPVLGFFTATDSVFYEDLCTADDAVACEGLFSVGETVNNFRAFIECIKMDATTNAMTIDLLVRYIEDQYKMVKKLYDNTLENRKVTFAQCGCQRCTRGRKVPIWVIMSELRDRKWHTYCDEYTDEPINTSEFSPCDESDFTKNVRTNDREKKNFYHMKKDIPRHNRNKGILPTKQTWPEKDVPCEELQQDVPCEEFQQEVHESRRRKSCPQKSLLRQKSPKMKRGRYDVSDFSL